MRYNNKRNFQKKDKYNKELGGMTVSVRQVKNKDGETVSDVNGALRVLKNILQKEGIFNDLRDREHYMSKGEKRRRAKAAAVRRQKKADQKRLEEFGF